MKEKKINNLGKDPKSFAKDFAWYFLGSFIPLFIGFVKTPVFTRHFTKEEYGYIGIVGITFTYLGMVLFSWIGSCIWRFYTKYELRNELKRLYSNLAFLYSLAFIVLLIVSITWYTLSMNSLVKQLIFYSFFQIILNQLFLFYMVVVRLKGKAKFYTVFQSIRALLSVSTALVMVFVYTMNISALVLSLVVIDLLAMLILIFLNPANIKINANLVSKENLKEFLVYGSVGLVLNISLLLITTSDRYIIFWFTNLETVGLYDQVYKFSQISIVALITIYFNTINPILLKELESNYENSVPLIQKYIKFFIIYGLPIIVYLSLFSKEIANIFLGENFREAYIIMPFVFIGAYMFGLSNFFELRFKFANKLKKLAWIAIIVSGLNIVLNVIFVALFGYMWAAVTTMISYFILLIIFTYFDKKIILFSKADFKLLLKIISLLLIQVVIFYFLNEFFEFINLIKISIGLIFAICYYIIFRKQINLNTLRLP